MKENALDIFVEDPLKELSEEVIQKLPQFYTLMNLQSVCCL